MNKSIEKTGFLKIMGLTLIGALVSAAINAGLFFIGKGFGAFPEDVLIPNQNKPITLVPVIMASILPLLIAGLVMGLLNRFAKKSKLIFNIIAVVLLLLSLINPFMIPAAPLSMPIMLNLMHIVCAGSLFYAYNKYIK